MPSVVTIGNFDGVHVGHRAILRRCRAIADGRGAQVVVLAFDPHPASVLRPERTPPRLTTGPQKAALLRGAGADTVVLLDPRDGVLGQSPAAFVEGVVQRYAPAAVVEGPDFRFGKGRAGDNTLLAELGGRHGFDVEIVPEVDLLLRGFETARISSTLVRSLVGRGRVADAARCLGRTYTVTAGVIEGDRRGRGLGFPTANLDPADWSRVLPPMDGVYAGYAAVVGDPSARLPPGGRAPGRVAGSAPSPDPSRGEGGKSAGSLGQLRLPAAISVGVKPTFGRRRLTIEAHLLQYPADLADRLYGQTLTVGFARWVRDQYRFPGPDALKAQLTRDVEQVARWHADGLLTPHRDPMPDPPTVDAASRAASSQTT